MQNDSSPAKILVVDDREENLFSLAMLLRRDDVEVLQARTGRAALELLLQHDVALALIDVSMPEMDGFELAALMRGAARTRHVPIVFVTAGLHDMRHAFQGYDVGAVDFLFKPIEPRVLQHKTETFVALFRQRRELANLLRLNEELLAVVSHDLRNPLSVIIMAANLLADSVDPNAVRISKRLQTSGQRMKTIINDLLDLTRARLAGGIPLDRSAMSLMPSVRRVIAELTATNPDRRIELHHDGDLDGSWDGARLEQMLSNLIDNALHHGHPERPVSVTVAGGADGVTVTIVNDGVIPADTLPHIFDAFRRGNQQEGRREGLGLGLYIADQIVRAHGGSIAVTSSPELGTTSFLIRLPR